jgi:Tfp pilus assembly protein PilN
MRPLNLASQPFKNERLPGVLVLAGAVAVLAITVAHGLALRHLMPQHTSAMRREVADLEREAESLRAQSRNTRAPKPDAATLAEWNLLKDLVDKRAFSWTSLFALLEETLPDGVRLNSVAPHVSKGEIAVELSASVRSYEDGLEFLSRLQHRPDLTDVKPLSRSIEREQGGGIAYEYRMIYRPEAAPSLRPAAVPSPGAPDASPAPPSAPEAAQ